MKLTLYTDGGARGNPGPAAAGVVIKDEEEKVLSAFGRYLGKATNNQAEYQALIFGLEEALKMDAGEAKCFLDSELLVKQLNLQYRVRDKGLAPLFLKAWNLAAKFKKISFHHIPREKNKEADMIVNETLNNRQSKNPLA